MSTSKPKTPKPNELPAEALDKVVGGVRKSGGGTEQGDYTISPPPPPPPPPTK